MTATPNQTNLMLRNDTILGVCEAIGQDFGINPNWLRVAFCVPIYWNPMLHADTRTAAAEEERELVAA
jgi:hypothetical protein